MNFDVSHGVHPLLWYRPGVFVVPGKLSLTKKLPGVPVVILLPPLPGNGTYAGNARLLRAVLKELQEGLEVRRRQPEVDRPDRLLKETSFRSKAERKQLPGTTIQPAGNATFLWVFLFPLRARDTRR